MITILYILDFTDVYLPAELLTVFSCIKTTKYYWLNKNFRITHTAAHAGLQTIYSLPQNVLCHRLSVSVLRLQMLLGHQDKTCVFCHGMKTVTGPARLQHVFFSLRNTDVAGYIAI